MSFSGNSHIRIGLMSTFFVGTLILAGCPGFQSDEEATLSTLVCSQEGCSLCDEYNCSKYYCDMENQCPSGFVCTQGQSCKPAMPSSGSSLGEPVVESEPASTQPIGCTTNKQCAAGQTCLEGSCTVKSFPLRPEGTCQFNIDCGPLGTCINSACFFPPKDDLCPPGSTLKAELCLPASAGECSLNSQCPDHSMCIDATCLAVCVDDSNCTGGTFCSDIGLCKLDTRPSLQCLNSSDCSADNSCVDGRCLASCSGESSCAATSNICDYGFCMPNALCFDVEDCDGSQQCINGLCDTL
ncbi:MAG TPA: hypothetical protein EYN66_01290 [Myxococcales bacterium]|nr:hypothetical protein [Myxococcales bacterium]